MGYDFLFFFVSLALIAHLQGVFFFWSLEGKSIDMDTGRVIVETRKDEGDSKREGEESREQDK